jgi:hypothetical protein
MWVPPNTLVLVRPGGIMHRVTELTKGHRTILKFIVCDGCEGLENNKFYMEKNQGLGLTDTQNLSFT